jgi:Sro7p-like protein associated with Golgi transport
MVLAIFFSLSTCSVVGRKYYVSRFPHALRWFRTNSIEPSQGSGDGPHWPPHSRGSALTSTTEGVLFRQVGNAIPYSCPVSVTTQTMAPLTHKPHPPFISHLLSFPLTTTVSNVRLARLLRSGSHTSYSDTRSSNLSGATTASTKTFLTALALNGVIASVEIIAFTIVWRYFRLIYEPRSLSVFESCVCSWSCHPSYLPSYRKRQPPLSTRLLGWLMSVLKADYRDIKNINGLDCYFFVRFLRMMVRIMLPIWLISWVVLLPLTSVNTSVSGHSGLDKFIFGNIASTQQSRYAGHLLLTWIFTSKISR